MQRLHRLLIGAFQTRIYIDSIISFLRRRLPAAAKLRIDRRAEAGTIEIAVDG